MERYSERIPFLGLGVRRPGAALQGSLTLSVVFHYLSTEIEIDLTVHEFSPLSGCGATVAHQLPKLRVAGSNPVARSSLERRKRQ